jgi:hypothetical protein
VADERLFISGNTNDCFRSSTGSPAPESATRRRVEKFQFEFSLLQQYKLPEGVTSCGAFDFTILVRQPLIGRTRCGHAIIREE